MCCFYSSLEKEGTTEVVLGLGLTLAGAMGRRTAIVDCNIRTPDIHRRFGVDGVGLDEYLKGQLGYTDVLSAHGYVCGISGKWHLGDSHHPQKGFTYWEVHGTGGGRYYSAPMIRHQVTWSCGAAYPD